MSRFDWYVINKDTKYIVAGFIDINEAETFLKSLKHDKYILIQHWRID